MAPLPSRIGVGIAAGVIAAVAVYLTAARYEAAGYLNGVARRAKLVPLSRRA